MHPFVWYSQPDKNRNRLKPKEGFLILPPSDEALQTHNLNVCLIVEVLKNVSKDFS